MKTTIDIHDELLASPQPCTVYRLPDLSVGNPCGEDPLEAYSWQDLCETICEHPGAP